MSDRLKPNLGYGSRGVPHPPLKPHGHQPTPTTAPRYLPRAKHQQKTGGSRATVNVMYVCVYDAIGGWRREVCLGSE